MMGLGLIALAGFILFRDSLIIPELNLPLWRLVLVLIFGIGAIHELLQKDVTSSFVNGFIVFVLLNGHFHWLKVGIWTLILAGIVAYLGLRLLVEKEMRWQVYSDKKGVQQKFIGKTMGASTRYINDKDFKNERAEVVFSSLDIYFDNAEIQDESANFNLEAVFSGVKLYVPQNWEVTVHSENVFSGVTQPPHEGEKDKRLIINAELVFSGLEIYYI